MVTNHSKTSQTEFVKNWFANHPNEDILHKVSKKALEDGWMELTGKRFEDSDRTIRQLGQDKYLIRIKKGVYRYDPSSVHQRNLEDFSEADKKIILKRDGFKCVICGLGRHNGVDLQVDHIKPKELGGEAVVVNGQTLCASHNYIKKIASQTETGKKMFIRLLGLAQNSGDPNGEELISFCEDILAVFEKHGINGHIEWKKE